MPDRVRDISSTFRRSRELSKTAASCIFEGSYTDPETACTIPVVAKLAHKFHALSHQKELQALRAVFHPNLVRLVGEAMQGSNRYIVVQRVNGQDLDSLLTQSSNAASASASSSSSSASAASTPALSWNQLLNVLLDVAEALCYLHNQCCPPLVHRDLKVWIRSGPLSLSSTDLALVVASPRTL